VTGEVQSKGGEKCEAFIYFPQFLVY